MFLREELVLEQSKKGKRREKKSRNVSVSLAVDVFINYLL